MIINEKLQVTRKINLGTPIYAMAISVHTATLYFAFRQLHSAGGIISIAAKCAHWNKVATAPLTRLSEASPLKTVIFLLFIS